MTAVIEKLRETKGPATLWLEGVADEVLAMPQDAARAVALRIEPSSTVSTASPLPSLSQGDTK